MSAVPGNSEHRVTRVLAWGSIILCLTGFVPFLWFVTHAAWGQGGELQGVSLVVGTFFWATVWAFSSLAGLVLSLIALRRTRPPRQTRVPLAALWLNSLSLLSFLILVLVNVLRARAAG